MPPISPRLDIMIALFVSARRGVSGTVRADDIVVAIGKLVHDFGAERLS